MITHKTLIACITLACSFFQANVLAEEMRLFRWQVGLESYYATHKEFSMDNDTEVTHQTAVMNGASFEASLLLTEKLSLTSRIRMMTDIARDASSVTSHSYASGRYTQDTIELRNILTYAQTPELQYFGGFGIRQLNDTFHEDIRSADSSASRYLYLPIGITYQRKVNGTKLSPTIIFNYLLYAEQYTDHTSFQSGDRPTGFGVELILPISPFANDQLSVIPFLRLWHTTKSNNYIVYDTTQKSAYIQRLPRTTTTEMGVNLNVSF